MSKIKDLKTQSDSTINIVDYITGTLPEGTKSKYVELFYKLLKKECNNIILATEYGQYKIYNDNPFNLLIDAGVKSIWDVETLQSFVKFIDYNERSLIEKNDLSTYHSFKDIKSEILVAENRLEEKKLEDSTNVIFEDSEWKILRPLSYESSLKYGANTRWCTASKTTRDQYNSYTRDGILIYCVNKKSSKKVACHKYLTGNKELTFWNETDNRVDSLATGMDVKYLQIIMDEINKNMVSNQSLFVKKKSGSETQTRTIESGSMVGSSLTGSVTIPNPYEGLLDTDELLLDSDDTESEGDIDSNEEFLEIDHLQTLNRALPNVRPEQQQGESDDSSFKTLLQIFNLIKR